MIYLFEHPETFTDDDYRQALSRVSPERRTVAGRYRQQTDRNTSVIAHLLLAEGLRREYALTGFPAIVVHEKGKPYLSDHPDIFFNLSHCSTAVACVLDSQEVGIDVERVRTYNRELAAYVLNERELRLVEAHQQPALAFTLLWTMKESQLKLTGEGISTDLKNALRPDLYQYQTIIPGDQSYVLTVCRRQG